jgi:hypothetical protein
VDYAEGIGVAFYWNRAILQVQDEKTTRRGDVERKIANQYYVTCKSRVFCKEGNK